MLKSEKGTVIVNGEVSDVIFELTHMLHHFIEKNPDIIAGILAVYSDELSHALITSDAYKRKVIIELALKIKKGLEDDK